MTIEEKARDIIDYKQYSYLQDIIRKYEKLKSLDITEHDKNGVGHYTKGMKPTHFLRDSIRNHQKEYLRVLNKWLKDG